MYFYEKISDYIHVGLVLRFRLFSIFLYAYRKMIKKSKVRKKPVCHTGPGGGAQNFTDQSATNRVFLLFFIGAFPNYVDYYNFFLKLYICFDPNIV